MSRSSIVAATVLASGILLLADTKVHAAAIPISTCGAVVAAGARAELTADVSCTISGPGITLGHGATLDLAEFALIGDPALPDTDGVVCSGSCRIEGPGQVREFSRDGVVAAGALHLEHVDIRDNGRHGSNAEYIVARNSEFHDNGGGAIEAGDLADADTCTFTGNGYAMSSFDRDVPDVPNSRTIARNCTVIGNNGGIYSLIGATVANSVVSGNGGDAVSATRIFVTDSQLTDNGSGIDATGMPNPSVSVKNSTISRNMSDGIYAEWQDFSGGVGYPAGTVKVWDSEISDNGGYGVFALKSASVRDSVVDRNGTGVRALNVRVSGTRISENVGRGVFSRPKYTGRFRDLPGRIKVKESTIVDNGCDGVRGNLAAYSFPPVATDVAVLSSTVTGNALDPSYPPGECDADIASDAAPQLQATVCGTSHSDVTTTDWDLCFLDP